MTQLIGQYKKQHRAGYCKQRCNGARSDKTHTKSRVTESNVPAFFRGVDGTDDGLEAVQQSKLAATVYNDKEGQARAMAQLAYWQPPGAA